MSLPVIHSISHSSIEPIILPVRQSRNHSPIIIQHLQVILQVTLLTFRDRFSFITKMSIMAGFTYISVYPSITASAPLNYCGEIYVQLHRIYTGNTKIIHHLDLTKRRLHNEKIAYVCIYLFLAMKVKISFPDPTYH